MVSGQVKMETEADFKLVYEAAWEEGMEVGRTVKCEPMRVVQRVNPLDDSSPIVREYPEVPDGPCGFAWVNIKPATSRFVRWLKKRDIGHRDTYYGGWTIWISEHGQSITRKSAHASALARALQAASVNAYSYSRMD